MRKSCAVLVAVVLSLAMFGIGRASIGFRGVVDPNTKDVTIQTARVFIATTIETIPTTGWTASGTTYDTFPFPDLAQWPDSVELTGTISAMPNVSMFPSPVRNTFYRFTYGGITAPRAEFYEEGAGVEGPRATTGKQRLIVSPTVVTGQMTVRLLPAGTTTPVVQIHDAVGNVVRSLECAVGSDGFASATWNREDGKGLAVPEGVYFCRYAAAGIVAVRKVLVTH
jgi:hypothetical protein